MPIKNKKLAMYYHSVSLRLILYILLFSSLVTFFGTAFQLYNDYSHDKQSIHETLQQIESSYLQSITSCLWNLDDKELDNLLNGILRLPNIQRLEVWQNGVLYAYAGMSDNQNIIQRKYELTFIYKGQENNLGSLTATANLDEVYKRLWQKTYIILVTQGIKTFLVSSFIFFLFYMLIGKHLVFMSRYAKSMSLDHLKTPLKLKRRDPKNFDELGHLVQAFNYMRENLSKDVETLEQVQNKLREQEKVLSDILETTLSGYWNWNISEGTEYLSPAFKKMLGYEDHELENSPETWQRLIFQEDLPGVLDVFDKHVKSFGKEPFYNEVRYHHKDGSIIWVICAGRVTEWERDGSPIRMVGCHINITKRKQAEFALKESENYYRTLFEQANEGLMLMTLDGQLVNVNQAFAEMHGYTINELKNVDIGDLEVLCERAIEERPDYIHRMQSGEVVRFEVEHRHKDGHSFPVSVSISIVKIKGDSYYLAFHQDLTERRRAEMILEEKEQQFRDIFNTSAEAILIFDTNGVVVSANPTANTMYGYEGSEMIGLSERDIISPNYLHVSEGFKQQIARSGLFRGESVDLRRDGTTFNVEVRGSSFVQNGKPYVLSMVRDITENKQAEKALREAEVQLAQAQKMESVGRLAGGVAHDFNNMLSVIIGNTELVLEDIDPKQPFYSNLKEIKSAAQRSADVTRQLLAFARKQTIAPKVIDLNEAVENILKMLRRLIGENIELFWHPGKELWPIKMDPSQLDQILANLSVNARDAITGAGKLTIETSNVAIDQTYCDDHQGFSPGEFVQITVSDNGCGMNREILNNLFEPFFTTKDSDKGTGLGMATVYGIVKQNDGFINVYSEPDKGTSFKIYLPRHAASDEQAPTNNGAEAVLRGNETVLLVEDEVSILKMTEQMLKRMGYSVLAANKPQDAIKVARDYKDEIHLLLTDVVMPEMNGQDLLKNLLPIYPNLKSLFMSGYTANVIAHHGVLDEGIHYIQKPFSRQGLSAKLREVLADSNS